MADSKLKILALSGSYRQESYNTKLLRLAVDAAVDQGARVETRRLADFDLPAYDRDDQDTHGLPAAVWNLADLVLDSDAWILASPEYNWSVAGGTKNAIDWLSRIRPVIYEKMPILLMTASTSRFGGVLASAAIRPSFEWRTAFVYPRSFNIWDAADAFDDAGTLKDPEQSERLAALTADFIAYAEALKSLRPQERARRQ
jgi:NAD(P)H-dependent FMN reductase